MDRIVDLDAVAARLTDRRAEWAQRGLIMGAFTWRDASAKWPQPIVTDRELVADPESLGMTFVRGDGTDALLVLWTGGWADFDASIGGQLVVDGPKFSTVQECVAVADRLADRLVAS